MTTAATFSSTQKLSAKGRQHDHIAHSWPHQRSDRDDWLRLHRQGVLPLIERHFEFDRSRLVVIDPCDVDRKLADERGYDFIQSAVTKDNYRELLVPLLTRGGGQGFCVNLSVDTSSLAIMELCREIGALYIDTVVEPWVGFYFDKNLGPAARSNYALRETVLKSKRENPGGTHRDFHLRRQSRHGLLVREAGSGQSRQGH